MAARPSVSPMNRTTGPVGALVLCAVMLSGCGQDAGAPAVATSSPARFVEAVRELVTPAERMGVVGTAALDRGDARPTRAEVDGLVADATRELREFRGMRLGDAALAREQQRLASAMEPVVRSMRSVRDMLRRGGDTGLRDAVRDLLEVLEGIPSAARS